MSGDQPKTNHENRTALPSIGFVIPYFGNWPFWFPFFLESCRANPSINWIFHTDCGIPADLPTAVAVPTLLRTPREFFLPLRLATANGG